MIRFTCQIFLTIFTLSIAFSQSNKLDSLKNALREAASDTAKISTLVDLAYASGNDPKQQLAYAIQAFDLGKSVTSVKHKSRSELILGLFYASTNLDSAISLMESGAQRYLENEMYNYAVNAKYIMGITYEIENKLDLAISSYTKAYELGLEHDVLPEYGNSAYAIANIHNIRGKNVEALKWAIKAKEAYQKGGLTREVSQALNQIGIIYDQKGLYSDALDNYLQARDLAIQSEDIDGEILINNNMGVIYDNMNNSEMAMQYYSNALEKARIHNMPANEATLLNNLSYIHLKRGDTTKAVSLLKSSLKIDLSDVYPCFESYPLEGMGSIYIARGKLDSAAYFLQSALETSTICEDVVVISTVKKDLGQLYAKKGNPSLAIAALNESLELSRKANLRTETKEALYALYEFHKEYNNSNLAMKYLEGYQLLTDSIYKENNVEKATQLASQYEFKKQVAKMEQERLESEQKFREELETKSRENRLILLALVLFFLLAVTLARSYFFIQKQNRKLKWLNDEKNKLMGIVAHDLRNPLNMIIGLMPLFEDVLKKSTDKNLEKYVELMGVSSERMRNMIDRVLDISAIENMKVNLKLEKTDLTSLTYESIHNFDVIAAQKQIQIIDSIDKSKELYSNVDPNYLVQVIDNLLSNAIKFSERGKKIEVSLTSENNHYEIKVKDQGPGITEEEQKNLFQAYTTLSSKPTAQERSTGLGLSIAYKFIKAMGGEIECMSKPGEGTTFNLIFDKV